MKKSILFVILAWSTFASKAWAEWDIDGGLEIPVQVGARAKYTQSDEFYFTFGAGLFLGSFQDINQSVLSGIGVTGDSSAEVVTSALEGAVSLEVRAGWDLYAYSGLYLEGGYMFAMGGKGDVDLVDLENTFGTSYHSNPQPLTTASLFSLESDVHFLTFHAGYRWEVFGNMILSMDVGLLKPFASSSTLNVERVSPNSATAREIANALKSEVESSIGDIYLTELFIPTYSLWLSYPL